MMMIFVLSDGGHVFLGWREGDVVLVSTIFGLE